jgi:hypothetical protein
MKVSLRVMALAAIMAPFALSCGGCATLAETGGENFNRIARTTDTNLKEIPTDVETLLLLDHPSYLSKIPVPSN